MSTIEELSELMPLPEKPIEIPSLDDWRRCDHELSVLPGDYKDFIEAYGTGVIDDFLWIYNPAATNNYLNLILQVRTVLAALEETSSNSPDLYPMPRFPKPGGFLPFAGTDNGDNLFWVTEGLPDEWRIAVMGPRSPECFYYECGLIRFLIDIFRGDVRCRVFPTDFPNNPPISFIADRE